MRRPTSVTVLALYLLIVFSLSLIMSAVGAAQELAPYTREVWLTLMIPKVFAIAAGVAFWRMLRIGVWLWFAGVALGWVIAIALTGFFPNFTIAAATSLAIVGVSIWIIMRNWHLLRSLSAGSIRSKVSE